MADNVPAGGPGLPGTCRSNSWGKSEGTVAAINGLTSAPGDRLLQTDCRLPRELRTRPVSLKADTAQMRGGPSTALTTRCRSTKIGG